LGLLFLATPWLAADNGTSEENLDEILQRYVEALGGSEALARVQSLKMTGPVTAPTYDGQALWEWARPNQLRIELLVNDSRLVSCYDGQEGWLMIPEGTNASGTRIPPSILTLNAVQLQDMMEAAEGFLYSFEDSNQMELIGRVSLSEGDAYKIKVLRPTGDIDYVYIDARTFYLVRTEKTRDRYEGPGTIILNASRHKTVGDITIPFHTETIQPDGSTYVAKIMTVSPNAEVKTCERPPLMPFPPRGKAVKPKIRLGTREIQAIDSETRIAVYLGPPENPGEPEIQYFYPVVIDYKEAFAENLVKLTCSLFPNCTPTKTFASAGEFDLFIEATYTSRPSVKYYFGNGLTANSLLALSFETKLTVRDPKGSLVDVIRSTSTAVTEQPIVWSAESAARAKAERALKGSLQNLGPKTAASTHLLRYLEELRRHRARPPNLGLKVSFDDSLGALPNEWLDAGEEAKVHVEIDNKGPGPAYDLEITTTSTNSQVRIQEPMRIAHLPPGERTTLSLNIVGGLTLREGLTTLKIDLEEGRGYNARPVLLDIGCLELRKPKLEIVDITLNDRLPSGIGDGDSQPGSGETIQALVRMRNSGLGAASHVLLMLNSDLPGLELVQSTAILPLIPVNEVRDASFRFRMPIVVTADELKLELSATETRGTDVAAASLSRKWPIRIKSPKIELIYQLFDRNSPESRGNRDGEANNGERLELALALSNHGDLQADDASLSIEPLVDIELTPSGLNFGEVPAGTITPEKRVIVDIPRWYPQGRSAEQLELRAIITQRHFPASQEQVAVDFRLSEPLLKAILHSSSQVTVGHTEEIVLQIYNDGNLDANGTGLEISTDFDGLTLLDESEVPRSPLRIDLGDIPARGSPSPRIPIRLRARRSTSSGKAPIKLVITENQFGPFEQSLPITILEQEAQRVSSTPDAPPTAPPLPTRIKPNVRFLDYPQGVAAITSDIVLRFRIEHIDEIIDLRLTRNDSSVAVGKPTEIVPASPSSPGNVTYSVPVSLQRGQNHFVLETLSSGGLSGTATLTLEYGTVATWVAIIGISDYEDPKLADLSYAEDDAAAIYRYYRSRGIPEDHLFTLLNSNATARNIKGLLGTQLRSLASRTDDTVIIYFAGHGTREIDSASSDGDGYSRYLLPYDADLSDLFGTALRREDLDIIFHRLRSEHIVFILDSCFSGGGRSIPMPYQASQAAPNALPRDSLRRPSKGLVVLSAAGPGEPALEGGRRETVEGVRKEPPGSDDIPHGVFTHYLLEGLRGAADSNNDGDVDTNELHSFVWTRVQQATGGSQNPSIEAGGQVVVGWSAEWQATE
jgi:hypothetical protein